MEEAVVGDGVVSFATGGGADAMTRKSCGNAADKESGRKSEGGPVVACAVGVTSLDFEGRGENERGGGGGR